MNPISGSVGLQKDVKDTKDKKLITSNPSKVNLFPNLLITFGIRESASSVTIALAVKIIPTIDS